MAQLGHGLGLALEPVARLLVLGQVAVQDLDRDLPAQGPVEAAIHDRHAALADALQQLVLVEDLSNFDQARRAPRPDLR